MSSRAGDQPALYLPGTSATIFAVAPDGPAEIDLLVTNRRRPGTEDDISATTARGE